LVENKRQKSFFFRLAPNFDNWCRYYLHRS